MKQVTENVTDTEVPLVLPNQKAPKGRHYNIEDVVDILRELGRTVMYDIKTQDAEYVRENRDLYEKQLNVYAHIWQELRGHTCITGKAENRVGVPTQGGRAALQRGVESFTDWGTDWGFRVAVRTPMVEQTRSKRRAGGTTEVLTQSLPVGGKPGLSPSSHDLPAVLLDSIVLISGSRLSISGQADLIHTWSGSSVIAMAREFPAMKFR
jgi:hypothetical protein